jgi:hypothetical protein
MNPIAPLVEKELEWFRGFQNTDPLLFPNQNNLYPIPFFGDIRNAKVLTLALNPSWTEFSEGRNWSPGLDINALTTRLIHYFDLPEPNPHPWFEHRRSALELLGCSYKTDAAHIDLHPFPTKFRGALHESQRKTLGHLIASHSKSHLAHLLRLAPKVKLVLVIDYTFSDSAGKTIKTSDFIANLKNDLGGNPTFFTII